MVTSEPLFQCDACGRRYRRKEHLTRHARRHVQTQPFGCSFCDKVFSRNDTLRQHIRINHKNQEISQSRAAQACNYCRSRRSRCQGTPCEACVKRGIQCSFTRSPPGPGHAPSTNLGPIRRSESIEKSPSRTLPYIQAYFEKFHPRWPFIHRATFSPHNEPAFLRQSVVMIGLWLTGESNAQQAAVELHEKLTLSINQQRVTQTRHLTSSKWPMVTYQGILLNLIFAMLKGTQNQVGLELTHTLPEIPSQLLAALVQSCLQQDMLFYPSIVAHLNSTPVPDVFIWVGIEEVKRFALALYKVCRRCRVQDLRASDGGMRGHESCLRSRSILSLADLRFSPPDSDELWEAESNLAPRVAANEDVFRERNMERNWICQTARLLQPDDAEFDWI
ncbi:C2H2 type zinc finger domain protein [Aspergillus alliaceus]|uniref:C2H2 type zinc finger domain protein n=1 Tax=Petromyces alliaceus TaxID=209559 RepID=UPI0012A47AD2|nr:C2H2 type zinc finger domain protein [Aspergillus alliaceus]KAB8227232.1 C2H2 type zinc finger domain protein [Aspergillus alliaceus]